MQNETVMPGQAPMRHENRSWIEGMPETLIACGNGCTDMREAHFHIKCIIGFMHMERFARGFYNYNNIQ